MFRKYDLYPIIFLLIVLTVSNVRDKLQSSKYDNPVKKKKSTSQDI